MNNMKELFAQLARLIPRILLTVLPFALLAVMYHFLF